MARCPFYRQGAEKISAHGDTERESGAGSTIGKNRGMVACVRQGTVAPKNQHSADRRAARGQGNRQARARVRCARCSDAERGGRAGACNACALIGRGKIGSSRGEEKSAAAGEGKNRQQPVRGRIGSGKETAG